MAGLESILKIKYDDDAVDRGLDLLQQKAVQVNDRLGALATAGTGAFLAMGSVLKDVLSPVFEKLKEFAAEFSVEVVESSDKLSTLKAQFDGLKTTAAAAIAEGIDAVGMEDVNVKMAKLTAAIVKPFELVGKGIGLAIIGEFEALEMIGRAAGEILGESLKLAAKKAAKGLFIETGAGALDILSMRREKGIMEGIIGPKSGQDPDSVPLAGRLRRQGEAAGAQLDIDFQEKLRVSMDELRRGLEALNDTIGDTGKAGWAAPGFQNDNLF